MDQLDKLPPAALIPFGVVMALIFAVRYLGLWQGQRQDQSKPAVAAMIVDSSALNRLSDEGARMTSVLAKLASVGEDQTKAIESLRDEMYIQRELRRNKG